MSETDTHAREPRADKVATVAEITTKLNEARAVFVTEYRGMSVPDMADLRNALRPTDAQHVIYKNTLTKIAVAKPRPIILTTGSSPSTKPRNTEIMISAGVIVSPVARMLELPT